MSASGGGGGGGGEIGGRNFWGRTSVRVAVIGDKGTGKSSLIISVATESFSKNVSRLLPPTSLPDDYYPDCVPVTIMDTSSSPEDKSKLIVECQAADAIVLTYACDRPSTLERLSTYWLPELRHIKVKVPVILAGCKLDTRKDQQINLNEVMFPIMQQFREIETCIECSALNQNEVKEVFYYAQKAVLHPIAPLFDQETQSLKPQCIRAFKHIFVLCDHDRDGALSDAELNDFQVKCFNCPLEPTEINGVKRVVQEHIPTGVNEMGITVTGFLFLQALFIEKGRNQTPWTVLRKFGYDNDFNLRDNLLSTSPDQVGYDNDVLLRADLLPISPHQLHITNGSLQTELKSLKEELAAKRNQLQKIEKLYDEVLIENATLKAIHGMTNVAEFSYAEVKKATNDFNDEHKIGEGGYGSVYKGVIRCTTVAIKILNKGSDQGEKEFNHEVETLQKVRHPNLVTLIGVCPEKWALVYEFLAKGSLQDCLRNAEDRKSLSWRKRIRIGSNICSALVFLHHTKPYGIVHGDLKPANILLDSTYTCKLSDFGTCRRLKLTDTTITPHHKTEDPRGTFCYFDPEYLASGTITTQSDVFAFGVVLLQLLTGREAMAIRMLVENALESGRLIEEIDALANWPLEVAEKVARLGLRCIQWSRKERPELAKVWIEIESMEHFGSSCS